MATVHEIKQAVGDDATLARAYLDEENASEDPRSTLVEHLESVIAAAGESRPTGDEAPAASEPEYAEGYPAGATLRVHAHANLTLGGVFLPVDTEADVPDSEETRNVLTAGLATLVE